MSPSSPARAGAPPLPERLLWPAFLLATAACAALAFFLLRMPREVVFPALSSRLVDSAGVIEPTRRSAIVTRLKGIQDKAGHRVVLATVPDLAGLSIETYADRLFRHWVLGDKTRNGGVLVLVAPTERKARIEVGSGLEGALTDALSSRIIAGSMKPHFRSGDFTGGIEAGIERLADLLIDGVAPPVIRAGKGDGS